VDSDESIQATSSPYATRLEVGPLATQTLNWSKTYGGIDDDAAFAVAQTKDGGYAIAGARDLGYAGSFDFWLLKTDAYGNEQWNRTFGGGLAEHAYSVVQASDGGYALAGITYSFGAGTRDIWLVKTDAYGNMEWNETYGGSWYDTARSMIQTNDSGYAIVGSHGTFNGDYSDFYLVKTDANGNMLWNRTFGGKNTDWGRSVVQTSDGGYAIAGYTDSFGEGGHDFWLVKADALGNAQWNKTYGEAWFDEAHSVVQMSDGGYMLAGCTQSSDATSYNLCLVKTDSFGNMQWNNTYGETGNDTEVSIVQTDDGGFAMLGDTMFHSTGDFDFLLVKIDSLGNAQWTRTYGGSETESAWALVQTGDGGYALAGYTYSFGAGRSDAWLVKTDESGFVLNENLKSDLNLDGLVNTKDLSVVAASFGSRPGDTRWNPIADVDNNELVDMRDLVRIAKDFGTHAV
jgi:hypothetical protein